MEDYELDESELGPSKPYTAEQRAAIDEINAEIAKAFDEYLSVN